MLDLAAASECESSSEWPPAAENTEVRGEDAGQPFCYRLHEKLPIAAHFFDEIQGMQRPRDVGAHQPEDGSPAPGIGFSVEGHRFCIFKRHPGQASERSPRLCGQNVAPMGAGYTLHAALIGAPTRILLTKIIAITNRTTVEGWAKTQPTKKAKLEHPETFRARPTGFQPQQELSQPVECGRLRMPGRAEPVTHFKGIGCVGCLAQVARQPEARLHDIELLQQQQIRPRPFAQPCSSFGAHAQTSAKSPGTLARAAGQGRKPAGSWP
jgi:hypothetical protein